MGGEGKKLRSEVAKMSEGERVVRSERAGVTIGDSDSAYFRANRTLVSVTTTNDFDSRSMWFSKR